MSSTLTKTISSSLSSSNQVNSFKPKNKRDPVSKKAAIVSKTRFNPQCPVVILKRPSSESESPPINFICVESKTKSTIKTLQPNSSKVNPLETKRKSALKCHPSFPPTVFNAIYISKAKSSPKGKIALGTQSISETSSFSPLRTHVCGRPRRNSVSALIVSNFNLSPEEQTRGPGSLSDDPLDCVSSATILNTIKESCLYNPENYSGFFNQDKKNQEALLLLKSLLSKGTDISQSDKNNGHFGPSTASEDKKKAMASHLLINLLKPSPDTSNISINQNPKKFYAGPQFKQAPNISSLPFPPAMTNRA